MTPSSPEPRYLIEKHTADANWAYRVRDRVSNETHGFGLLAHDALALAIALDIADVTFDA